MDILRYVLPSLTQAEGATRHDFNVPKIPVSELPKFDSVFIACEADESEARRVWVFVLGKPLAVKKDQPIILHIFEDRLARNAWMEEVARLFKEFDAEYIVGPANLLFALRVWGVYELSYTFEDWLDNVRL